MSVDSKAAARLRALFDDGIYTETDSKATASVVTAYGNVNGNPCFAFCQDATVDDGAMTQAQAKRIIRLYELAEKTGNPIVGIYDSLGGKVSEGMAVMDAYAQLVAKAGRLSGVVPQISVIAGTCAASAALWALCSDVVIMTKEGELFVNAPSLIDDETVGTTKCAVANGTAHIKAGTEEDAMTNAREVLSLLPSNNLSLPIETEAIPSAIGFDTDAMGAIADADSIVELRKGFGTDTVTALARLNGIAVGMVKAEGALTPDDCKKIASLIGLCDAFSLPIISIVNTTGFERKAKDEWCGIAKSAAALTKAYAEATTVKITLITGNCYGPAYLTFAGKAAGADAVYALKTATVAAMSPDTAALIVNKETMLSEGVDAAIAQYDASADTAAANGYVDEEVDADNAVAMLTCAMDMLASKRVSTLDKKHVVLSF